MALIALSFVHFYDPLTIESAGRRTAVLTFELATSLAAFVVAAACMGSEELKGLLRWLICQRRRIEGVSSGEDYH